MNICIIGGSGHIGSFLVPKLAKEGHDVMVVSTCRSPVPWEASLRNVTSYLGSYIRNNEEWGRVMKEIDAEVVIDLLGVDLPATYNAVRHQCSHIIACGSLWMYGPPKTIRTPELTQGPCEFPAYAKRYEEILAVKDEAKKDGIAFTAIMPPNICGPGKIPLECRGGRVIAVHKAHARGEIVYLPEGCETLIGPCDASDVANGFFLAVHDRDAAADEIFNVGSDFALTAPFFIEVYARIYKTIIPILEVPVNKFMNEILPDKGANYHFREHMHPDIAKIRSKLKYRPEFSLDESMARAVQWMRDNSLL